MSLRIFTDSSFDEVQQVCGLGIYIEDGVMNQTISTFIHTDNNNYGEMYAIYIASILGHGKDATIYTDSQLAVAYINNQVKEKPRSPQAYERHQRLRLLGYKIRQLKPNVVWIKGHKKTLDKLQVGNQLADILARQGRSKI